MLFVCQKAREVWRLLGVEEAINNALKVELAGEAILEFLLMQPAEEVMVLGMGNFTEVIAIGYSNLPSERRIWYTGRRHNS